MEFVGLISEGETLEQFDHFREKREDRYNFMQIFIKFRSFQKFLFCLERNRICALNAEQKWINDTHFRC